MAPPGRWRRYVMNRMGMNLVDDPRKMAIIAGVYESLAGLS
jgi:hypothetical protein